MIRSYGGARSSAHLTLMKVNLGSATNALCNNRTFRHHHHLSWDSEPRAKHGKASGDKDAFKRAFQRGFKLRRRRTMCAASKSAVVDFLGPEGGRPRTARLQHPSRTEAPCAIAMQKRIWQSGLLACCGWRPMDPDRPFATVVGGKVIFAVLRYAWRGSAMPSIASRGSLRHD